MNSNKMRCISIILLLTVLSLAALAAEKKYDPIKESLVNYEVPEWYQDAKFGIWPHWGVYSVPAYRGTHAAEWYGRWIYCLEGQEKRNRGLATRRHHVETYGDPGDFGYHDFVPKFKAEKWNPEEWAQMAVDAGAKFFCMMGMHSDGFAMYDSDLTRWNVVDMGPRRNVTSELAKAVRYRGLKFGVSNHFAWNCGFFSYYHQNGFAKGRQDLADFYSSGKVDDAYLQRWWLRTTELLDKVKPDLYYFDWGWHAKPWVDAGYHEKFTAYLYNRALEWGRGTFGKPGVVLNSKFKPMASYCVLDLERRKMTTIQKDVWQTDTSISVYSWGYSTVDEYRSADQLIDSLIDIVSKNGIMMLNFGPKADGTVPPEYRQPLLKMGDWLKINGEAIYATRPYTIYGEGPVKTARHEDHEVIYTGEHIRFTRNKDCTVLYAIPLGWPDHTLRIGSLARGKFNTATIQSVRLLGTTESLSWKQKEEGLFITLPVKPDYDYAYPIRIQFTNTIPTLQ